MAKNEAICDVAARADRYMYQAKTHKNSISTEWGIIEMPEHAVLSAGKKKSDQCILVVDDSEMNRAILCEMLKDNFDTLEAENGEEAYAVQVRPADLTGSSGCCDACYGWI